MATTETADRSPEWTNRLVIEGAIGIFAWNFVLRHARHVGWGARREVGGEEEADTPDPFLATAVHSIHGNKENNLAGLKKGPWHERRVVKFIVWKENQTELTLPTPKNLQHDIIHVN
ncbi:hypothetical protein EYF80_027338 [Liparis tanakae]|uniref:Uncharacterized protein n=1 Tax=Liparis tanakae TaxID=230148 RepID=A0A4Z2HA88_9TELE|nr:hypothetical protein EYF80_027338 [Liparis tanakae]